MAERTPRVVTAGNFATPHSLLGVVDRSLPTYRLWALNAQHGVPEREGVIHKDAFVGAGMRTSPRLEYFPARLNLVHGNPAVPADLRAGRHAPARRTSHDREAA